MAATHGSPVRIRAPSGKANENFVVRVAQQVQSTRPWLWWLRVRVPSFTPYEWDRALQGGAYMFGFDSRYPRHYRGYRPTGRATDLESVKQHALLRLGRGSKNHAGVVELADALDPGSNGGDPVEVQVLSPAPTQGCRPPGRSVQFYLFQVRLLVSAPPRRRCPPGGAEIAELVQAMDVGSIFKG